MFFSETILSAKGPLAKVWLAAHMEKKLTKAQLLQADLKVSIVAIGGEGSLPMALRLSGQLLLGVVRIYSRKAKYLLEDCNEANIKLKMAFRPGVVDLPADQLVANLHAITLPDVVSEFALLIPDPDFNLKTVDPEGRVVASQTVSRPQDILLRDEFGMRDDFGLGDGALRGFDDFLPPEDAGELFDFDLLEAPMAGVEAAREAGVLESPAISIEPPRFKTPEITRPELAPPEITPTLRGFGAESVESDLGLPPLPGMPPTLEGVLPPIAGVDVSLPYHAKRLKRKLMVDAVLEMDPRQLKQQLEDTSDITREVVASKRPMHYLDLQEARLEDYLDPSRPANLLPELYPLFPALTLEAPAPAGMAARFLAQALVFEMPVEDVLGAFEELPPQVAPSVREPSVLGKSLFLDAASIDGDEALIADHETPHQISRRLKLVQATLRAVELIKADIAARLAPGQAPREAPASFTAIAGPGTEATRSDAVRLFFEMLVLNTKDVIDVQQAEPYGDMAIWGKDKLFDEAALLALDA
ncbi:sister chromatid cohesion protein 1 [Massospora cicadina]|nr:sister chromatid cohesion protein 1 [Massospora cicadina]